MRESSTWNTRLTPPPGGLARLARTLAAESAAGRRPHVSTWVLGTATACSLCLALGLAWYQHEAPRRDFELALRDALAQMPAPPLDTIDTAIELPSSRPDVRIVLVVPSLGQ